MTAEQWPDAGEDGCIDVIWFRNHKPELWKMWNNFLAALDTNRDWLMFAEACVSEALRGREAELAEFKRLEKLYGELSKHETAWSAKVEAAEAQVRELKEALQRGEWIFGYPCKDENGEPSEQTFVAGSEQLDKVEETMKDVEGFFLRWAIKSLTRAEAERLLT